MRFQGQLTWNDYLHSQVLNSRPTGAAVAATYALITIVGIGVLTGFFLTITGQLDLFVLLVALVAIGYLLFTRYFWLPRRARHLFTQQKDMGLAFEAEITEEGLKLSNELGSSLRPWKNFVKWKEDRELLLLFLSDITYVLLPKRFLTGPEQLESIHRQLARFNVPAARNRSAIWMLLALLVWLLATVGSTVGYYLFRKFGG